MDDEKFIYSLEKGLEESKRRVVEGTGMISFISLQMKPVKVSEEVVRNFRKNLEETTENELKKCDERSRRAHIESQTYILD